jgi:hypothetical protein
MKSEDAAIQHPRCHGCGSMHPAVKGSTEIEIELVSDGRVKVKLAIAPGPIVTMFFAREHARALGETLIAASQGN